MVKRGRMSQFLTENDRLVLAVVKSHLVNSGELEFGSLTVQQEGVYGVDDDDNIDYQKPLFDVIDNKEWRVYDYFFYLNEPARNSRLAQCLIKWQQHGIVD